MIYIDSNIPMYLVGSDHENKQKVLEMLPALIGGKDKLVTSVESFQEIIHRYLSIKEIGYLHKAYEAMENLVDEVFPHSKMDSDLAKTFVDIKSGLSSRDCIHLAVMKNNKCKKVWSFDKGFDSVVGIKRVY